MNVSLLISSVIATAICYLILNMFGYLAFAVAVLVSGVVVGYIEVTLDELEDLCYWHKKRRRR